MKKQKWFWTAVILVIANLVFFSGSSIVQTTFKLPSAYASKKKPCDTSSNPCKKCVTKTYKTKSGKKKTYEKAVPIENAEQADFACGECDSKGNFEPDCDNSECRSCNLCPKKPPQGLYSCEKCVKGEIKSDCKANKVCVSDGTCINRCNACKDGKSGAGSGGSKLKKQAKVFGDAARDCTHGWGATGCYASWESKLNMTREKANNAGEEIITSKNTLKKADKKGQFSKELSKATNLIKDVNKAIREVKSANEKTGPTGTYKPLHRALLELEKSITSAVSEIKNLLKKIDCGHYCKSKGGP